jgi:hypothetical protein
VRSISVRTAALAGIALLLLAYVALRVAAVYRVAFNWDELVLFQSVVHSVRDGIFRSGGRPGLAQLVLLPWLSACQDEIASGRAARLLWLGVSLAYLGGIAALLAELTRGSARRLHDVLLGVALLALVPAFLEWSIQVRTDQLALAGGVWGAAALLASERRPALALASGMCFALGWLASQKLAYVAGLGCALAALRLVQNGVQPPRELARAALIGAGATAVWLGFRTLLGSLFELAPGHPARAVLPAALVRNHLDVFDFYSATIGWSQIREILPTLWAHGALAGLLVYTSVRTLRRGERDPRLLAAWLVLALGAGVALFHAARFSYFWMTLGLFPAAALALAADPIRRELLGDPQRLRAAAALLWLAIAVPGAQGLASCWRDTQAVQRESVAFVHRNFPPDAQWFHPESALFCSATPVLGNWFSYTIYRYFGGERREAQVARFEESFRAAPVRFMLDSFRLGQFPPELQQFWSDNYQPYRASVYVAGRRLRGPAGTEQGFELIVPGDYRWIPIGAPAPIEVDGHVIGPGEVLSLAAGAHDARFPADVRDGALVLALNEPPRDAPRAFYTAF